MANIRAQRRERLTAILAEPETITLICEHIAERGTLWEWTRERDIPYNEVHGWIHNDHDRLVQYTNALEARTASLTDTVITGLRRVVEADPRKMFDKNGKLLAMHELPDDLALATAGMEVTEDKKGNPVTKLRINDRGRGHELLGKHLGMYKDKLDVTVSGDLASRLAAGRKRAAGASK